MNPYVAFENVGHHYRLADGKTVAALHDVSFTLDRHEFVAVVGPSGCGKSTLLRLLSGLLRCSVGSVRIFGQAVTEPRDDVGIVFQKPTLLPWLSVLDNVLFPLRHKYGRYSRQDKVRAQALLQMAGLSDVINRKPDELSGGMQQRVGIARALLLDPEILIMDEPFSALDALTREDMGFELLRIWNEKPKTVLFITHSIAEAVLLADRVLVMSPRPGTLADNIRVDLPRPRSRHSLQLAEFGAVTQRIRAHIYRQPVIAAAPRNVITGASSALHTGQEQRHEILV